MAQHAKAPENQQDPTGDKGVDLDTATDPFEVLDVRPLRQSIPEHSGFDSVEGFVGKLTRVAAFDLAQERLDGFSPFRFLYERLLGADVRPWLPSAFCAGAAMPHLRPARRKLLLQSLSEAAATAPAWSSRPPTFFPEYVDLADEAA